MSKHFVVVGTGIAGLYFALKASDFADVTIITKKRSEDANTFYAQGGIAAVMSEDDSFESHITDTLSVGDGLCRPEVVEIVVKDAPKRIVELKEMGVPFTERKNDFDLGKEGGHSKRRIVHAGDITGREIHRVLLERAQEKSRVRILEGHFAVDLITRRRFFDNEAPD